MVNDDSVRLRGMRRGRFVGPMAKLPAIVRAHAPVLVLDAASALVQIGLVRGSNDAKWATSTDEAGVAVFAGVEKLGVNVSEVGAFVFCDGPGSVLGIRTVAMALRAWNVLKPRPCFAFCSLALVAQRLGRDDVTVIADARRETWHAYQTSRGLRRVAAADLTGALVMPENFRHWSPLPPGVARAPYSLAELLPRAWDADLFLPTEAPDAFLHEEPSYVTWTPQVHRAPGERDR